MISWTAARLRRDGDDEGLTLVEVIVALLVFATIIAGSIAAVGTVLSMTADNREREVASNLAQQAIDVARDEAVTNIVDQDENVSSPVVNDVKFTVRSVVAWVTTKGIDTKCTVPATSGNGALLFRRVSVTVTWDGMRGTTKPVRADTVVSPTSKINDPTLGTVLISVQSVRGTGGVGGVTASIAPDTTVSPNTATVVPAAGQPGRTNNDGCTVATKLSPGSYTVTLSPPAGSQYRDPLQAPNPVKRSITVAAGDSSGASFTYDPAMDAQPSYASNLSGGFAIPKDLTTSFVSSYGATTITPPASDVYLSPVPSGYQVYAGLYAPAGTVSPTTGADTSCLSTDPTTWPAKPGTTLTAPGTAVVDAANPTSPAPAPVNMGGTTVTIPKGDTIIQAVTTTPANGDPGCKATQTLTITRTGNSGTGTADVKIALPYGTWGVRSGTSLANLRAVSLKDVIGGLLGTGTSTNVVTIDPRLAS
ncbi:hypothetical protein [Curtobacterium sp. MCPF17_047]|uniref:hypothetical protein n=1 Tax=Curtobacterium sp. MCPF17_047 TaxID=2175654 RepID=UPI0011B48353|nr:hypothetical protein [Curtobacterium sp. MCPF17_047]